MVLKTATATECLFNREALKIKDKSSRLSPSLITETMKTELKTILITAMKKKSDWREDDIC